MNDEGPNAAMVVVLGYILWLVIDRSNSFDSLQCELDFDESSYQNLPLLISNACKYGSGPERKE